MEKCKVYHFNQRYTYEKDEMEADINIMLEDGWKCKSVSTSPANPSNEMTMVIVIYERKDEPQQKHENID